MDLDGAVAYVSSDNDGPLMKMSSEYVQQVANGSTSQEDAVFEIRGVLIHEFTHLIQANGPIGSNNPSGIEGYADAIRCACGGVTDENRINGALNAGAYYDESRKSGNTPCPYVWQLPYGTSGYFMAWLRYYDGDFLRKLTVSINNLGSEWSLDKAVQYILGDQYDIETLWNEYIEDVKKAWEKRHGVVIVASEGLKYADGTPIVKPIFKTERATYFGDVSTHLATLIIEKLGIKARSEKPGLICRCDRSLASKVDLEEAVLMGRTAIKAALNKTNGVMAGIRRISTKPYKIEPILIPIEKVMMTEATFPLKYIKNKHDVSDEFIEWLKPLIDEIPENISFLDK